MHDLKTQLGDYLDHVVQRLDVEDFLEGRAEIGSPTTPASLNFHPPSENSQTVDSVRLEDVNLAPVGRSRRVGVLVAVAATTLLVVGLVVAANGGDDQVATVPASQPSVTVTVPSPSAPEPAPSSPWVRIPHDVAVLGGPGVQSMLDVTAGGPGLVAVGAEGSGDASDAAVWTSVDGITWARTPDGTGVLGGTGDQTMWGVTAGGPGLVAVGRVGADLNSDGDAAVWTSVDGITWARVSDDAGILGGAGDQAMFSVVQGGPGLVAVGVDGSDGDVDAAVWTSVDGVTWARAPDVAGVLGGPDTQSLWAVTAGGPGLVAVGWGGSGGDVDAAVWTSVDGIVWSRVNDDEAVLGRSGRQMLRGVTAGGPGLVAVGHDDSDAAVWTSVDGTAWSRVLDDEAVFGGAGREELWAVTTAAEGLMAVGRGEDSSGDFDGAVWTSADGISWSRVEDDDALFGGEGRQVMNGVTVGGPGLVVVGNDGADEADAAVWVVAPAD